MLATAGTKSILGDCFIAISTVFPCASAGAATIAGQFVTPDRTPIRHAEAVAQAGRIPLGYRHRAVFGAGFNKGKPGAALLESQFRGAVGQVLFNVAAGGDLVGRDRQMEPACSL